MKTQKKYNAPASVAVDVTTTMLCSSSDSQVQSDDTLLEGFEEFGLFN